MSETLRERLSNVDFNAIVDIIAELPDFETPGERRANYVRPAFFGRPGGDVVIRGAKVQGDRPVAAASLASYLVIEYGPIADGVESVGVFLAHAARRAPALAAAIWRLIDGYGMLDGDGALRDRMRPTGKLAASPHVDTSAPFDTVWPGPPPDGSGLERMVRKLKDLPAAFLDQGRQTSRAVALLKVTFPAAEATGTGFVVAPDLILTCHHVLFDHDRGDARATTVEAWFDYETDHDGRPQRETIVACDAASIVGEAAHDWAVVRLATELAPPYAPLRLSSQPAERGTRALIVQHPGGGYKRLDFGDNPIWHVDDDVVQYFLNTDEGSSGAPVFNERWEVVALHHRWGERREGLKRYTYNQGVSIGRVREGLRATGVDVAGVAGRGSLGTGGIDRRGGAPAGTANHGAAERQTIPSASHPDDLSDPLQSVHEAVHRDGTVAALAPDVLGAALRREARDWTAYRLKRIAHWKQPKYNRNVDRRFTRLTLLIDQGEGAQSGRWAAQDNRFDDLGTLLEATEGRYGAVVVLGVPGVGKTTLLRRLELDMAIAGLQSAPTAPLTFFVSLGEYRDRSLDPRAWLRARWMEAYPHLPSLDDAMAAAPFVLLLDALNEMPHTSPQDYADRVQKWREELEALTAAVPGVRCVFTCRSLDYSASLSTDACQVPHVRVELLNNEQMKQFLKAYLPDPEQAGSIWERLSNAPALLDLCRTPYYLSLLTEQVERGGTLPSGRAALFTGFVRRAMKREVDGENARFEVGALFSERDRRRITGALAWPSAHALPHEGSLVGSLETLADAMQRLGKADDGSQVVVPFNEAAAWLAPATAHDALMAGASLGILDVDEVPEVPTVRFAHQLMQEYFAARVQARTPEPDLLRSAWSADDVAEPLAATMARIAEADPLPPLPATGWEETAVMAAEMMDGSAATAYVDALAATNVLAAARCAIAPDVPIPAGRRAAVRKAIYARMTDPAADLRARIAAGQVLGDFGDPVDLGFERREGPHGEYLMPPLVAIPAGRYPIGSNDHWDGERPAHKVNLAPFSIGRYPVTNAEYRCFVDAGGYLDERWWETEDARLWLRGDPALVEATKELRRTEWAEYPKDDAEFAEWCRVRPNLTQTGKDWLDWFRSLGVDELEAQLSTWYPAGDRRVGPSLWDSSAHNNPLQPVVGVSWYEARAYGRWLAEQTGQAFALPSEFQHEAAARGLAGRMYAYPGPHDTARCNTYETHIRGTTPVGVFPGGTTPDGIVDLTGNVFEWTRSLWGTDAKRIDDRFRYREDTDPADPAREDPDAPVQCLRVGRGGSWVSFRGCARAAFRNWNHPTFRNNDLGFRVVVSSPIL